MKRKPDPKQPPRKEPPRPQRPPVEEPGDEVPMEAPGRQYGDEDEPRNAPGGDYPEEPDAPEGDPEQEGARDYLEEEYDRELAGQPPRHLARDALGSESEYSVRNAAGGDRMRAITPQPAVPPAEEPYTLEPEDLGRALLIEATQAGSNEPEDDEVGFPLDAEVEDVPLPVVGVDPETTPEETEEETDE